MAKRVAALVFTLVLLAPHLAEAACAWVLWVESPMGSNQWKVSTSLKFVYEKRDECERHAQAALDAKIRRVEDEEKKFGRRLSETEFWTCLPDTMDPRGPKGGPR